VHVLLYYEVKLLSKLMKLRFEVSREELAVVVEVSQGSVTQSGASYDMTHYTIKTNALHKPRLTPSLTLLLSISSCELM
jgi:hypothetical protein